MVYDFGGGTFDVTILQAGKDGLYAIATDGEAHLGGRVIDERIMRVAAMDFLEQHKADPLSDPGGAQRLRRLAEQAKIALSRPGANVFKQSLLLLGKPYDFVLTRDQLDRIATEFVAKTIQACNRARAAADLSWRDIDAILLTGGSSLLPQVARDLQTESGKAADIICRQPHQAVAFGAAIYADRLSKSEGGFEIRQATTAALSLRVWSIEKGAPALETLIARNVPLPAEYVRTFYTNRSDQTQILLEFVQTRGEPPEEFTLGRHSFGPILNPEQNYPVEVTVSIAADGTVSVRAQDGRSGRAMNYTLGGEGGA
jgi:molecular chaperone DnaK